MKTVRFVVSLLLSGAAGAWSAPPSGTPAAEKPSLLFLAHDGPEKSDTPNGEKEDVSELTLMNAHTKEVVVLVLGPR